MKLTKPIITLSAIITGIVAIIAYQVAAPIINGAGLCEGLYGTDQPCSLIGFDLPLWWRVGAETVFPASILFGVFCSSALALFLLAKAQQVEGQA